MSVTTRVNVGWPFLALGAVLLVAAGAGVTYVAIRTSGAPPSSETRQEERVVTPSSREDAVPPASRQPSDAALTGVQVPISAEAAARAGITIVTVGAGEATTGLLLPGVVEPNAYRQAVVTSLVGGRVTEVFVELGGHVRRGQALARLFSSEVADAHTRYVSMRADLDAHERELARTERLVEIGAASRQELDRIHAEHTARTAEVQSARSRLELLGVPPASLDAPQDSRAQATAEVSAPMDGIVIERLANVGVNIDPAARLFTVVDLSTVWVVADLYEKAFSQVRVGSAATVTTSAYPGLALQGRVSYIDPQISPQTRTAKLRVEVPNPQNQLRLGMYANVEVSGARASSVPMIPRGAVQTVDDRHVVYLVDPGQPGSFTEREVRIGRVTGDRVEVLSGVQIGDTIVADGSFYVRAERERLGLPR